MEEKKRTNKWSYSTSGKNFRGFLCLVTFAAFVISAVITIYAVERYGKNIIFDPEPDFTKHVLYQSELESEAWNLLNDIHQIYNSDIVMDNDQLTIVDYSMKRSRKYDLESLYYSARGNSLEGDLSVLDQYYLGTENLAYHDLTDYSDIQNTLSDWTKNNSYLYLDTENFRELFRKTGLPNTNRRFSENFPEECYFIFDLHQVNDLGSYLTEEECAARGIKYSDERFFYPLTNDVDFTANYAMYQPGEELFFTPYDMYFTSMDHYIYNLRELTEYVDTADPNHTRYDSIILPLLNCFNYSVGQFVSKACTDYEQALHAEMDLRDLDIGGIFYYYESGETVDSNVPELSVIEDLPNHYRIEKGFENQFDIVQEGVIKGKIDFGNEEMESIWKNYPTGTLFYVAIAPLTKSSNLRPIVRYYQEYEFLLRYVRVFGLIAIVTLILTIIQAVQLIKTTGRSGEESTEILLNHFDKLPTELWFIVVIGVTIACIVCGRNIYGMLYPMLPYIGIYTILITAAKGLCIAMPFALAVMLFTLSLERRIQSHNLWNRMLLRRIFVKDIKRVSIEEMIATAEGKTSFGGKVWKLFLKIINAIRNFFRNMKGTRKLAALFVLYIVVNFICTVVLIGLLGTESVEISIIGGILYLMFQILAVFKLADIIKDINKLTKGVEEITKGDLNHKIENDKATGIFKELTDGINHIGDGLKAAVETSLRDERMKTELITNVSHDLKTPLTSIINYIELLKAEKMPTPEAEHYIEVLDGKAQRMKQLAEDLVEAAKANSGNIELEMMPIAFDELMKQAFGEFEDKFARKELSLITHYTDEKTVVLADGRRLYRVIENVLQNVYKYALSGTRVYADLDCREKTVTFMLRNISAAPLNISPEELMERFTRGDSSRTTEGSGLGLSIAKDLTNLQGGSFEIQLDGDLFKVIIEFPQYEKEETL